jgi:hypothetical protein
MSKLTEKILGSLDYAFIQSKRRSNYQILNNVLAVSNELKLELSADATPMIYPYMQREALKRKLIDNKIFVATYWSNVLEWCSNNDWESQVTKEMVAIPIDQRYDSKDMKRIVTVIEQSNK